jgi:hypothetical protein
VSIQPLWRSSRSTKTPQYLQDFHLEMTLPSRTEPTSSTNLVKTSGTAHPLSRFLSYDKLFHVHKAYTTQLTLLKEATSFFQVVQNPKWREAMQHEITVLQAKWTWSLVSLPPHKRQSVTSGCAKSS